MTDEQIIETLDNLRGYCAYHRVCKKCKFEIDREEGGKECQLEELAKELSVIPTRWKMNRIKKLLEK